MHSGDVGLYIVKQGSAAHGGTVEVRADDAQGTTFAVTLPRDAAPRPQAGG